MAADETQANRILVVGTTPDYIAYIHEKYPRRTVFLTDTSQRMTPMEASLDDGSEVVTALQGYDEAYRILTNHLRQQRQHLSGITCYDCEWLELTSILATRFGLPYSSAESVRLSRSKLLTKQRWTERGVPCPRVSSINSEKQAIGFVESLGRPAVLKPMTGTGSELTFRCDSAGEAARAFRDIRAGLSQRKQSPLYRENAESQSIDPTLTALAEEFIQGDEYSADFIVDGEEVQLIRTASKLRDDQLSFGTTLVYTVPAELPNNLTDETLKNMLGDAARALGFTHAICMVDFIVGPAGLVFLELTPRVGGDCLPPLVRQSCNMDTIGLALDFAEGREPRIPGREAWTYLAGLRLFAASSGILSKIRTESLTEDRRVREIYPKFAPGHKIVLPPEDYNSWMLGHVIFEPSRNGGLLTECEELMRQITIEIE